jgi:hypothetical protein
MEIHCVETRANFPARRNENIVPQKEQDPCETSRERTENGVKLAHFGLELSLGCKHIRHAVVGHNESLVDTISITEDLEKGSESWPLERCSPDVERVHERIANNTRSRRGFQPLLLLARQRSNTKTDHG